MYTFVKPASRRRSRARPSAKPAPAGRGSLGRPMSRRERELADKHRKWREKHQDILVTFVDTVRRRAKSTAERAAKSTAERAFKRAPDFGVVVRSGPELRPDLPRGHPPIDGIEHIDPVIVTVAISSSMAQAVELLEHGMPFEMSVIPIPSERCNVW